MTPRVSIEGHAAVYRLTPEVLAAYLVRRGWTEDPAHPRWWRWPLPRKKARPIPGGTHIVIELPDQTEPGWEGHWWSHGARGKLCVLESVEGRDQLAIWRDILGEPDPVAVICALAAALPQCAMCARAATWRTPDGLRCDRCVGDADADARDELLHAAAIRAARRVVRAG